MAHARIHASPLLCVFNSIVSQSPLLSGQQKKTEQLKKTSETTTQGAIKAKAGK
jgi:hypothetical protein